MTTHYSILACRIPGTEEPGQLQSLVGSFPESLTSPLTVFVQVCLASLVRGMSFERSAEGER